MNLIRREQLFAAFFFTVLLFLLYQFYLVFESFLQPLSWAALLALMFYPAYAFLLRLLKQRENLASFLFTTGVLLLVIVPTLLITVRLATESVTAVQRIRELHDSGQLAQMVEHLRASPAGRLWQDATPLLHDWNIDLPALALRASKGVSAFLVAQVGGAAANVLRFAAGFGFGTFALFFFFRDGERMVLGLRELIPMRPNDKDTVLKSLYDALSAVVQGTLATALAQGLLAGLGFRILGVPFAALLGCATAFLSLIPMAGPIVWMGVVIYLLLGGDYLRAGLLVAWGTLIVGMADNIIRPLIIGGRTQIPTAFLFFGILGGLQAYGFLGVFLGPALIAILVAFLKIYREQYAAPRPPEAPT